MSGIVGSKLNHRGSGLTGSLGTDGQHLLSSGAGETNVFETIASADLTPVRQDLLLLGLKQAVQENSTKFNLANSALVKFEADADFNLAGSTTVARNDSEYVSSIVESTAGADAGGTRTDITNANTNWGYSPAGPYAEYWGTGNDMGSSQGGNWGWWSSSALLTGDYRTGIEGTSNTATSTTGNDTYQWGVTTLDETNIFNGPPYGNTSNSSASAPMVGFSTNGYGNDIRTWKCNGGSTFTVIGSVIAGSEWSNGDELSLARSGSNLYLQIEGVTKYTFLDADFLTSSNMYVTAGNGSPSYTNYGFLDCFYHSGMSAIKGLTTLTQNATGTALGTTNVPTDPVTEVSGVLLNKDTSGSTTFGTDVKVYFTADNSNFTEATSYDDAGTFSDTTKMIKLGKTTVTSGSDVRWKIVWANQSAGSLVSNVYGIGLNY